VLACGCLVGVYETYDDGVIATIDARGAACRLPAHRLHARVSVPVDSDPAPGDPPGARETHS
jgi:hypothetical protein